MNIKKYSSKVYRCIKDVNYIMFFMSYVIICCIIVFIFDLINTLFIDSDILIRFELGLPLVLQLILTYIVYRKNHENRFIKITFIITLLYTLASGILSIYELYFTKANFTDILIYYVANAQLVFQFMLVLLLMMFLIHKKVDKLIIIKPFFMICFTIILILKSQFDNDATLDFIVLITLFVNIFNPVLLYIISYTTKRKLL
jgi:hypothetical protein